LRRHGLHAIANTQNGKIEFKDNIGSTWRALLGNRLRAARKDDARGIKATYVGLSNIPSIDLAVNANFSNAARYELRVLGAKIENKNAMPRISWLIMSSRLNSMD
jgi:hypothetical protein